MSALHELEQGGIYRDFGGAVINLSHPRYRMLPSASAAANTAGFQAALNDVPASGATLLLPPAVDSAVYQINGNLIAKAKTRLFCPGKATIQGIGAVGHIWTFTAKGALAGPSTTITATITRGDKIANVVNTAVLNVGDPIEITGSTGATSEAQNSANGPQRELNEVQSITDGTHLVLKYPAGHTYNYDPSYTAQGVIAKVTPMDDVSIEGINFDTVEVAHGYNRRFALERSVLSNQADLTAANSSSLGVRLKDVEITSAIASAGANANAFLHGYRFFRAELRTFGGHFDGVQMFGCCDGRYAITVNESTGRGIYLYKSQTVKTAYSVVQGTQVSGVTNEALLFNYCYDCDFTGYLDERGKLSSITEFRGDSRNCNLIDVTAHCAYTYPITWKGSAQDCSVRRGKWYSYYNGGVAFLIDLQIQAGMPWPNMIVDGPKLISKSPNTGFGLVRTVSTTQSDVVATSDMTFRGVEYDRGSSNFINLAGTGLGQKIDRLTLENNHSTKDDPSNGALIQTQVPIGQFRVDGVTLLPGTTRRIQCLTGTIDAMHVYNTTVPTLEIGANVTALYYGDNAISTYTIPDLTVVKAGIMEGLAVLDFPSIAAGGTSELTISVTGLQTTDKVRVVPPAAFTAGIMYNAWISGTGVIRIREYNTTVAAIDPGSGTFQWQTERRG